jgi:hypothetical protein
MLRALPILLHPPKTGGISLRVAVANTVNPAPRWATARGHQLPEYYGESRSSPAAVLVRNPYTRFVAMYNYAISNKQEITPALFAAKIFNQYVHIPDKYCYNTVNPGISGKYYPCYFWHRVCTGHVDVIRFETYNQDVQRVYGIDMTHHQHLNRREGQRQTVADVSDFYSEKILAIVNLLCHEDFEHYGYTKFDSLEKMTVYCNTKEIQ